MLSCLRRKKEKEKVLVNKIYNSNSILTFRSPIGKKHELSSSNSNINEGFSTNYQFENK
jgi:hypothetical protein